MMMLAAKGIVKRKQTDAPKVRHSAFLPDENHHTYIGYNRKAIFMKALIIIPAHNEEKTIENVIEKAKKYGDVLIVNDASIDNTEKIAKECKAIVIAHKENKGLGASLRDGFDYAIEKNYDVAVTIDADGQHDPEEIKKFLKKIGEGYDFVLGRRIKTKYPFFKRFGGFFLNCATNFISGTNLNDTESGFRAIKVEKLKNFYLKSDRYQIAVEIVFEAGRNKLKTANVFVHSPLYVKGVGVMDGVKNFLFLMHRRERNWFDYIEDFKYVFEKWLAKL